MKANYMNLNGDELLYDYECTSCHKHYPTFPVYYPGNRLCKFCPECGHKFVNPEAKDANKS